MARQIIRLTESDLHRIIKESVKRILREEDEPEYTMEDLEAAKAKMQALRKSGNNKAFMQAAAEWQKIREKLNQVGFQDLRKLTPDEAMNWSEKETIKKGFDPEEAGSKKAWRLKNGIGIQKQLHKDIDDEKGPKINPDLGIV